jgi:hypothetical protein
LQPAVLAPQPEFRVPEWPETAQKNLLRPTAETVNDNR